MNKKDLIIFIGLILGLILIIFPILYMVFKISYLVGLMFIGAVILLLILIFKDC